MSFPSSLYRSSSDGPTLTAARLLLSPHASDQERGFKQAQSAAAAKQLWHPAAWALWEQVDDELFEKVVMMSSEKEWQALCEESSLTGTMILVFAKQSKKLNLLLGKGLPRTSRIFVNDHWQDIAIRLAFQSNIQGLVGLAENDLEPPRAFDAQTRDFFKNSYASLDPRSALHMLASKPDRAQEDSARLTKAIQWLASAPGALVLRNAKGLDPLKAAISVGNGPMIKALLGAGSSLSLLDAKGLDVFAFFEKTIRGCAKLGAEGVPVAASLKKVAPLLKVYQEHGVLNKEILPHNAWTSCHMSADSEPEPRQKKSFSL